jgi:xanthine/uracil/vitamin C permease (AzgA family)
LIRLIAWWNGMSRQGRTGWTLVAVGVCYLIYFLKTRLFEIGPPITGREWLYVIGMAVLIMLGTINIRMAEMRERNQKIMPLIDTSGRQRK